jgi:hypothetical protein
MSIDTSLNETSDTNDIFFDSSYATWISYIPFVGSFLSAIAEHQILGRILDEQDQKKAIHLIKLKNEYKLGNAIGNGLLATVSLVITLAGPIFGWAPFSPVYALIGAYLAAQSFNEYVQNQHVINKYQGPDKHQSSNIGFWVK